MKCSYNSALLVRKMKELRENQKSEKLNCANSILLTGNVWILLNTIGHRRTEPSVVCTKLSGVYPASINKQKKKTHQITHNNTKGERKKTSFIRWLWSLMNTNDSKCLKRSYRAVSIFFFSKCMRSVSVSIISANVWDFHIRIVCLWYQLGQNQKQSLLETHWHPTCEFRGLALKLWPLSCWVMRFPHFPLAFASHFGLRMCISF